jgi:hypothetical protein
MRAAGGLAHGRASHPGDFAVVAKKRHLLAQMSGAEPNRVRLLEQDVAAKNLRTMKIGF